MTVVTASRMRSHTLLFPEVNWHVSFLVAGLTGYDAGVWLVGGAFLQNVYSVWSFDDKRIGFATLKS
jgi:hypothetical protein